MLEALFAIRAPHPKLIPGWPWPKRIPGDYHFGNVICRHDGPELAAIVDWELTTIGDPLLDLGWLLATWPLRRQGIKGKR